jgi:hypothetical protein
LAALFGYSLDDKFSEADSDGGEDEASLLGDDDWLRRADVYSFAVTCFQILTGEVPYANLNWKQLVNEVLSKGSRPKLPAAFQSKWLNDLLESCWGHDPAQRPTFSAICNKLLEIIQLETTVGDENLLSVHIEPALIAKQQIERGSRQKPPLVPTSKNPYSTTSLHPTTAKNVNPLNMSLLLKHTGDMEHGMGVGVYDYGVHLGLTESDIERNEGIDINYEDDSLQPYYEIKRLLWIKRNTVYSVALNGWDRKVKLFSDRVDKKEKRSGELKNKIYQLIGAFLVMQGVLLIAVAQLAQSNNSCKKVWNPVILSALVWTVTIVAVWQKLSLIQVIDDVRSNEDEVRRVLISHHPMVVFVFLIARL